MSLERPRRDARAAHRRGGIGDATCHVAPIPLAAADRPITTSLFQSSSGTVSYPATGDTVALAGEVHLLTHVTFLADGSVQLDIHANWIESTGPARVALRTRRPEPISSKC